MTLKIVDEFHKGIIIDALLRFLECTLTPKSVEAVEELLKNLGIDRKEAHSWIKSVEKVVR